MDSKGIAWDIECELSDIANLVAALDVVSTEIIEHGITEPIDSKLATALSGVVNALNRQVKSSEAEVQRLFDRGHMSPQRKRECGPHETPER